LWQVSIPGFPGTPVEFHEPTAEQACQDVVAWIAAHGDPSLTFSGSEYRAYPNVLDCYFDRLREDGGVLYRYHNFPVSLNCAPSHLVFDAATKTCVCPEFTSWSSEANNGEGACIRYVDRNHDRPGQCPRAGNPIFPLTGVKTQQQEIGRWLNGDAFSIVFDNRLALPVVDGVAPFARQAPQSFGRYWQSSHHKQLLRLAPSLGSSNYWASIAAARGGHVWETFLRVSGNVYSAQSDSTNQVYDLYNSWRLVDVRAQSIETYSYEGALESIAYAGGGGLSYTYSTSTTPTDVAPAAGLLLAIRDPFDRVFQLRYEQPAGVSQPRIKAIVDPQGQSIGIGYDLAGNLTQIFWPDGFVRHFVYERNDLPWALSGIVDENNQRHTTYGYDSVGRATSTESAGGVNRYAVGYQEPPSWTITEAYSAGSSLIWRDHTWKLPKDVVLTEPNGSSVAMQSTDVLGMPRLLSRTQPAGAGCDASTSSFAYDANGNIASRTDFNGNKSCHVYDLSRNLETASLDGLGGTDPCPTDIGAQTIAAGANQRKTMTQWHPDWNLPAKRAEPGKITISVYNGQPDPTSGNVVASCAPATAVLPDGKPIAVLCKQIEQATSDSSGERGLAAADPNTVPLQPVEGEPDPWFDRVSLLLHLDGVAGGTSFPDSSVRAHTPSATASGLTTDPVSPRFGTAAGIFTGGYLLYPPSSDWDMGGGDFTVEMWAKFNATAMGSRVFLLGQGTSSGGGQTFYIGKNTANQLTMLLTTSGTSASVASGSTVAANTWYHLALVRAGNVLTLYRNGVVEATAPVSGSVPVRQTQFGIGVLGEYTANYGGISGTKMAGWLDEVRITKGQARYTGPFALPARAFGDANGVAGYVPRVRVRTYTYNELGQVLTARDPLNNLTTYTYHADTTANYTKGDLKSVTNPAGHATQYTRYDKSGRLLESVDANGTKTETIYTPRGWVKTVTTTPPGAPAQATVYDYDGVGQLKKATLSDGTALEYSYDAAHRLRSIKDAAGNGVTYTLDNMGNRTGEELKDTSGTLARNITRVYDALNRVQSATGAAQ
jgi:YD repeat-containing protein